jgi:DNA repair exonuclease SbcCD ATPase subunit
MKCNHKSLENIHCFKCDKTCIELLDEQADRIRELEAEVEKYKMLAEDRKDDAEVLSETIDDIIKLKENLHSAEFKLQEIDNEIRVASPTMRIMKYG